MNLPGGNMQGPEIITHTMSWPSTSTNWQYHSRSNQHSKVACWAILFDLLRHSPTLQRQAQDGSVVLGINEPLGDAAAKRTKKLDLIIASSGISTKSSRPDTLADLAIKWNVRLNGEQQSTLAALPAIACGPVGTVRVALKAKACMTEHIKARPRLRDELTTYHQTIHAHSKEVIAVGLAIVNASKTFISSDKNGQDANLPSPIISEHPNHAAARTVEMLREIPIQANLDSEGYDAFGVTVIDLANDGSPVELVAHPPAPARSDDLHYDRMLDLLVNQYEEKYSALP